MPSSAKQTSLFRGIYEFDDPSGTLLAARVPIEGSLDLYDGTAIVVRPNQCALFVHKGKLADILGPGTHYANAENVPILTKLANWRHGFRSPVKCEIYFFSGQHFTGRRWGTSQPVITQLDNKSVPIRSYGHFSLRIKDPVKCHLKLLGTRATFSVSELEEFIQGHILQLLPNALESVTSLEMLSQSQARVGMALTRSLATALNPYGIEVSNIQVLSLLPPNEVIQALDAKLAMSLIGNKREYLLYKAANSLDAAHPSGSADPAQLMMGLMLGKTIQAAQETEPLKVASHQRASCAGCQTPLEQAFRFCPGCGKEQR